MTLYVSAEYTEGCFCDRPGFAPVTVDDYPRFEFAKAVRSVAALNGIGEVIRGKYKTASGVFPFACSHRESQAVRFSWSLFPKAAK